MAVPTTEHSQMLHLKNLNPLTENNSEKSINLRLPPARTLPSIAEGLRQVTVAAQCPLSTSDPASPQSFRREQIKQEPQCQGHRLHAPRHLKVPL